MTDKEFIAGIIDGTYNVNDVAKYCKSIVDVDALLGDIIAEWMQRLGDGKPPICAPTDFTPTPKYYEAVQEKPLHCIEVDNRKTIDQESELERLSAAIYYIENDVLHIAPTLQGGKGGGNAEPPKEEFAMQMNINGDEACKWKRYAAIKAYCKNNPSLLDLVKVFVTAHKMGWIKYKPQFTMVCELRIDIPINPKTGKRFSRQSFEYHRDYFYKDRNKYSNEFERIHIMELEKIEQALNALIKA